MHPALLETFALRKQIQNNSLSRFFQITESLISLDFIFINISSLSVLRYLQSLSEGDLTNTVGAPHCHLFLLLINPLFVPCLPNIQNILSVHFLLTCLILQYYLVCCSGLNLNFHLTRKTEREEGRTTKRGDREALRAEAETSRSVQAHSEYDLKERGTVFQLGSYTCFLSVRKVLQ